LIFFLDIPHGPDFSGFTHIAVGAEAVARVSLHYAGALPGIPGGWNLLWKELAAKYRRGSFLWTKYVMPWSDWGYFAQDGRIAGF